MLKLAREKNKRRGITGMLLHCDGFFIQALEGLKEQDMDLISVIRRDLRQNRIAVLFEGPIKTRSFSEWSMGFNRPSQEELAIIEGYTPYLDLGDDPKAIQNYSTVAIKLLAAFRELSEPKSKTITD